VAEGIPPVSDRTIQTRTLAITFREDGLVHIRSLHGLDQNVDDARENLEVCRQNLGGKKAPLLVDVRKIGVIVDKQTRTAYATESDFALAQAMLVDSAFTRIAANLYIRISHRYTQPGCSALKTQP